MVTAHTYERDRQNDSRPGINIPNSKKKSIYDDAEKDFFKNKIFLENKDNKKSNNNEFMELTMEQLYNNIYNLLPNLYNDYHKKYLETSLRLKSDDKYVSENIIVRETLMSFIFNNKNMMYVGIVIILISFLLYMINL
jgi:hypothetical protein